MAKLYALFRTVYGWGIISLMVVIVLTTNSFLVLNTIDELTETETKIANTDRIVDELNNLHVAILTVESGQRGYLLTQDEQYLADYRSSLDNMSAQLNSVATLSSAAQPQQQRIEALLRLSREKLNTTVNRVELAKQGELNKRDSATGAEMVATYRQIKALFNEINKEEMALQQQHRQQLRQITKSAKVTFVISTITTSILLLLVFSLIYWSNREAQRYQQQLEQQNNELEDKVATRTEALQLYSDEIARSNRELEDFAFVASHDLQEPLRKIRAFGDRLESGYAEALDERGKDFLARMLSAAARMSQLISDLLEFSRVSTRGKPFSDIDLNAVMAQVTSDLEVAIEEKSAIINLGELPTIEADGSQLTQLFLNIVSNALKFQPPEQQPVVNVYASQVKESELTERDLDPSLTYFDIYIEDNGIGFDQDYEDKIFTPFQRLHSRSSYAGTGIGLAVCRRIVERHNGQIRALSEPNRGAKFIITLAAQNQPFDSERIQDEGEYLSE
ncbi:sensor histidine kinase [Alteromonas flava]|uniref:sensor histidine kinase n=1 Tax=Alteromonas flava TaxID=2048003 RepID=UPI000C2932EB|nr:sensor histidine kinase [Alteromonas flava]